MASWETQSQATTFSVGNTFENAIAGRNRGAIKTGDSIDLKPFGDDSVVGINADHIPAMQEALTAYITDIDTVLKKFEGQVNAREGVAGNDINEAIYNYFVRVKEYLFALVSNFKAFNDKLDSVSKAYIAFQGEEKTSITTSTNQINVEQYKGPQASS